VVFSEIQRIVKRVNYLIVSSVYLIFPSTCAPIRWCCSFQSVDDDTDRYLKLELRGLFCRTSTPFNTSRFFYLYAEVILRVAYDDQKDIFFHSVCNIFFCYLKLQDARIVEWSRFGNVPFLRIVTEVG